MGGYLVSNMINEKSNQNIGYVLFIITHDMMYKINLTSNRTEYASFNGSSPFKKDSCVVRLHAHVTHIHLNQQLDKSSV